MGDERGMWNVERGTWNEDRTTVAVRLVGGKGGKTFASVYSMIAYCCAVLPVQTMPPNVSD